MITQKTYKIEKSEIEAKKMAAYKTQGAVYDKDELSFKIKHVSGKSFRLIHNDLAVFAIIEGTNKDTTLTIYKAEEFVTEQQSFDRIDELELEYHTDHFLSTM